MTEQDLVNAVNGIGGILAGGLIDVSFAHDGPGRFVGVAHEMLPDGTDREVAVVHTATYGQAQVAMHAKLVHAGHGAVMVP